MESASEYPDSARRRFSTVVLSVLSLLLSVSGVVLLANLLSRDLPPSESAAESVLPALIGITAVTAAASASLAYVTMRAYRAWGVAVIANQIAVAACCLVAVQGATVLIATPARGCFAGVANLAILILLVATPAAVALIVLAAIGCLIVLRPRAEKSVAKWVKQLPVGLVVLIVLAGALLAASVQNSTAGRYHAVQKRTRTGSATIGELVEALKSPDINTRFVAVQELRKMGPRAKAAVPALAEVLSDNQMVSWPAADALANIGPDAAPAIPALVAVIEREQGKGKTSETGRETPSTFSWLAGKALARIGRASIAALLKLLAHDDRFVRMTAAQALGTMEPPAQDATPALNNALSDQDEYVRRLARLALDRIDKQGSAQRNPAGPEGFPNRANAVPIRAPTSRARESAHDAQTDVQEIPIAVWTTLAPYTGDPRNRPPGTVCLSFNDGYRWLIRGSVQERKERLDGDRKVEVVVSGTRRYEHLLGTNEVRIIDNPTPEREGREGEETR